MRAAFRIGRDHCPPGETRWVALDMPEDAGGSPITCFVGVVHGARDGPVLYVGGAAHGEELVGVAVAHRLALELDAAKVAGTVLLVPVQNVPAYLSFCYTTPWDGGDLSKSFPGDPNGSLTARMAHRLFHTVISRADAVIDVHTAMVWGAEYPQAIVLAGTDPVHRAAEKLARSFPFGALVRVGPEHLHAHFGPAHRHSLIGLLATRGVPYVLLEVGEGGRMDWHAVDVTAKGLRNAMRHLGMLQEPVEEHAPPALIDEVINVRAPSGGLVNLHVPLGGLVREGALVATILSLPNRIRSVNAPIDGIVLRVTTRGLAVPGERLVALGVARHESREQPPLPSWGRP